jgi:hypothetical protein
MQPMAEGGQWLRAPYDAPPVYVPGKQLAAHFKRLVGDGWLPCDDPRREEDQPPVRAAVLSETALQARIDQLEAMVRQLLEQKGNAETDQQYIDAAQAQFIQDAHETNDAARAAFNIQPKNTRSRKEA